MGQASRRRCRLSGLPRSTSHHSFRERPSRRSRIHAPSGASTLRGPGASLARGAPQYAVLRFPPHDPYRPYAPYDTQWAQSSGFEQHERDAKRVRDFISDPLLKRFGVPSREELLKAGVDAHAYLETERDWYDGSVPAMDAEIGRLFEGRRGLGIDESTLVVFTSDHGEEFFEHGRMFHGQSTYGELNHVAL
ncbi:MAG TPA: sulfatase-like hydrolase/transferase, partial [Candidatus Polarisedimenticolia bacterium]|nr:sulfatase-like hydrolase/transferase [Candidatus Polarisedimenticolia bacterium]